MRNQRNLYAGKESASICGRLSQRNNHRLQDDPEVEDRAPVIDVPEVVFDATLHLFDLAGFTAKTIYLCPTRQARFDVMPERIIGDQAFIFGVV